MWPPRQGSSLPAMRRLRIVKKVMADAPMTVVETERFLKDVKPLLSDAERAELVAFIAANPEAGEVISETGGVRKVRWALAGKGKRGGARVIYYYHSERLPVFLLAAYAKNEKANLSRAERNAMKRLVPILVADMRGGNRRRNDYENQNQAGGEEGGASPEEPADRRCANHRGTGAGHRVDPRRERNVRVTLVHVPEVDVRKVRTKMG